MRIRNLLKRNLWAIIFFNFKMLPFRQAIKFPFDFYGKVKFKELTGKVKLKGKISRCMVEFGHAESDIFPNEPSIISIKGTLEVRGNGVSFGSGLILEINKDAHVILNRDILVAPRNKIIIRKGLTMGQHIRFSWEGQIFDSNFHYTRNVITGEIKDIDKPITVGDHVWIGNRVTLNKGTVIPNNSIVASNSLCNKDYSREGKIRLTIAGCPGKIVAEGYERIFETIEPELCEQLAIKFTNKSNAEEL